MRNGAYTVGQYRLNVTVVGVQTEGCEIYCDVIPRIGERLLFQQGAFTIVDVAYKIESDQRSASSRLVLGDIFITVK